MKKEYKDVINNTITLLEPNFEGLTKRETITMIFDHIESNKLLEDYEKISLFNTIYYFLRKRQIFSTQEIKYRFDSIDTKLGFLNDMREDLSDRWWFYQDLFFGNVRRPVISRDTKVLAGNLNYIIDSTINPSYDMLYTMLYFRDMKKMLNSDVSDMFVKRRLNDKLYGIFDDLYDLDSLTQNCVFSMDSETKSVFFKLASEFYHFLSLFNVSEYRKFHSQMVKNINQFRAFIRKTNFPNILDYNKNRFFDAITFTNIVYSSMLRHMNKKGEFSAYTDIHYLISSTTYFVFFKFVKKMSDNYFDKLVDYFNSDLYFSYTRYIIEYYNLIQKEVKNILMNADKDVENDMVCFDIVLRYMLYNKFRNLINSNIKRYISVDIEVNAGSFTDVDSMTDCDMFECELYEEQDPTQKIINSDFSEILDKFFGCNCNINREDVTNVAIDICNGTKRFTQYDHETIKAGKKLVSVLREGMR